jgi:N-acetylneuraminic acid mutarotase
MVLVAGGSRANGASVAVAILFDPDSRTWSDTGRLGTGRSGHTATLLEDGTVLVAGGYSDLGAEASAEVYRPGTTSWSAVGSMAEPRGWGATATLLRDGTVLVAGGYDTRILNTAEVYNPGNDQWAPTAAMPQGRSGHSALLLDDGTVLVFGGDSNGPGLPQVTLLYDPDGGP